MTATVQLLMPVFFFLTALLSGHKMVINWEICMRRNAKITKDYIYLCSLLRVIMYVP